MSTSAPVRREVDIPIVEPRRYKPEPKRLPQPNPERIVTPFVPIEVPVKQPVPYEVGVEK